jgi:hypothetical protein
VASLLQHFTIGDDSHGSHDSHSLPLGMLALPPTSFNLRLKRRQMPVGDSA